MPTTVERIDTWIVDIPTIRPHVLSMTSINRQVMMLVRVHCSDGIIGTGEGTTVGGLAYGDESPEGMKLAIDTYFSPLLLDREASEPAALMALLRANIVGNHFAKNAIETALLDAAARRAGLPLSTLLGGRIRDTLPVLWTLASGDTAKDIAEAEAMITQRRHKTFKLKIGKRSLDEDVAHVAAIKRALGDKASVRVDVNQAWDSTSAHRGANMLADAGVDLIEQPLPRYDRRGMAQLTRESPIAIMADEALRGPHDAMEFVRDGAAHAFSIKPSQAGGLFAARDVAAIAQAAQIGVYGGTMLDGSIGTIASAHLFGTLPALEWGTELFGPLLQTEEILTQPLAYADFALTIPSGPGLGVELDMDKVNRFRRDGPNRTVSAPSPQGECLMLFMVRMDVHVPHDIDPARFEALKATEKARAEELQRAGKWRHLWRIAGQYANISIFDVADAGELHDLMMSLPLFPFMTTEVTALCRHPSAISAD